MVAIIVDVLMGFEFLCVEREFCHLLVSTSLLYHDAVCSELVQSYVRSNLNLDVTS
jgi:hypothetical protein